MITFKFRLLSDEVDDFLLDVEVPYDMTLLEFHNFLNECLNYEKFEMCSFFYSDVEWEKLQEFTLLDMGVEGAIIDPDNELAPPVPMSQVKLSHIVVDKFERLIYEFDLLNERQLFVELLESKIADGSEKLPRIIDRKGTTPEQFPAEQQEEDIFGEAMSDFNEFAGDDSYDDQ